MTDEYERGRRDVIAGTKQYLERRKRGRVDQVFEREVRRLGLAIDTLIYDRYALRAVLTIPGSNAFAQLALDEEAMLAEAMLASGSAMGELIACELRDVRDRLIVWWHLERVRGDNKELPFITTGERCREHTDNIITRVLHSEKTYRCDGPQKLAVHGLPDRCVIVRGGGIEVIEP